MRSGGDRGSLWRQLAKSGGSRLLTVPVAAAAGLLTTGIQVRTAGAEVFGAISLIATLALLLPFADLGMGAAVTTAFARVDADRAEAEATWASALRRLSVVAAVGVLVVGLISAMGFWNALLGLRLNEGGQLVVGWALSCFFVSVPLGLGQRALTGVGLNHLAATIPAVASVVTLVYVWLVSTLAVNPLWMSVGAPLGLLTANASMTFVAWRVVLQPRGIRFVGTKGAGTYLAGSAAMLVINVGVPVSLQSGRLLLSHLGSLAEVAQFSIMMQFYGIAWGLLTTSGLALWPIFVQARGTASGSLSTWRRMILLFASVSFVLAIGICGLGPGVANYLSDGKVVPTLGTAIAFSTMLLIQALHLPAGMMLTTPSELRWQAVCVSLMCLSTIGIASITAPYIGAISVPLGASIAVLTCQLIPDLVWAPKLIAKRTDTE